ncbi:MAG TPA: ATP synthase subunit I [Persephonella sp.]|uniref:Uncharacterized protein n=1 Tax=Persephonella marina (strain DSM 14350 / EX-H1) TaxID=123214 RepID=C0QS20_PERMH|nr:MULTISPECIES: ATP synthase subunit I [Persephonella]ACO03353.1 hypothetical protein PERMA_1702 [Persephonella marina EX-H1]HCB69211.1 ATP synthase subunit I [Persephonella sp.]
MKIIVYALLFFLGYLCGILFFNHLFKSSKEAILKKKRSTGFFRRFIPFSVVAVAVAYFFKIGILFFLLGFYLSRLTFTRLLTDLK